MHHSDDDNPERYTGGHAPPDWATQSIPVDPTPAHEPMVSLVPLNYQNDSGIKYDTRIATSTPIVFQSIERCTERAILLNILNTNTGEMLEEWFPKKLMSNLDESACTIRCWTVFAEDKKQHLWAEAEDDAGTS